MSMYRPGLFDRDAALRARQRMEQRVERRSKRRLAKHLLERKAQWRRNVLKALAVTLAALLAGQLMFGEVAAAAQPGGTPPAPCAEAPRVVWASGERARPGHPIGFCTSWRTSFAIDSICRECSAQVQGRARPRQLLSGHWVPRCGADDG
ncbi:hypothetical protein [Massilia sp. MS-15]|uniref:hypothetical protein n=1 Tax=Massilia sp. MS-15 TaxID=2878200 RepID=UPI001CD2DD98|nr:hypothetical protein [Massilia sp. MS-15]